MNRELIMALMDPNSKRSYFIIRHWARRSFEEMYRAQMLVSDGDIISGEREQLVSRIIATCRDRQRRSRVLPLSYRLEDYRHQKQKRAREEKDEPDL